MAQILVFGASTTWGAWDSEGGWVTRLRRWVDEKNIADIPLFENFFYLVYNLGVPGDTTDLVLQRFEPETEARIEEKEETVFIFAIVINDASFDQTAGKLRTSLEKFKENLEQIVTKAKKYSNKILLVSGTPVEESKTCPIPWDKRFNYQNQNIEEFNNIAQAVSKENGAHFIDVYGQFKGQDYEKLLADGLHPNFEGHQKIFEIVKNYLVENNILE